MHLKIRCLSHLKRKCLELPNSLLIKNNNKLYIKYDTNEFLLEHIYLLFQNKKLSNNKKEKDAESKMLNTIPSSIKDEINILRSFLNSNDLQII
jgi:hypothetical protein